MSLAKNAMQVDASKRPGKIVKYLLPVVAIALIALRPNRFPVRATTGVCPFAPQVRPER